MRPEYYYEPPRRGNKASLFVVGLIGAGALYVANHKFDWIDLPEIPAISDLFATDPATASASVDQESYQMEVEMDIDCTKRVSVAVDVEAFKNGPVGDGVFEKKVFGDFLICSDNREISSNVLAKKDPITGEITELQVELSGVYVEQPRVDHLDVRNCIDGNVDDSMEEIDRKIEERKEEIANGEEPGCDDGFKVTQLGGSDSLAEAIDIGFKAAQLAIAVDANPVEIINASNEQLDIEVKKQLQNQLQFQDADIDVVIAPGNDTQTVQAKIDRIIDDLQESFNRIDVGNDEKGNYIYVEDASGAHATVHFTGFAELDVNQLEVSNIETIPNPRFNPARGD